MFAFHALTGANKRAVLSMLSGLLSDSGNVQAFNDKMGNAVDFTLERLWQAKENL